MKKFIKILKDGACEQKSVDGKLTQETAKPERKGKRRRFVFKIMFVVSMLSMIMSLTYSWFVSSESAIVDGVEIDVREAKVFDMELTDPYGVLEALTGDGVYFFKPEDIGGTEIDTVKDAYGDTVTLDYSVTVYDKPMGDFEKVIDVSSPTLSPSSVNGVRIMDITLKGSRGDEIFLSEGTEIRATAGTPEYLPGALRVAVLKLNGDRYETKAIWIPDVTSTVDGTPAFDGKFSYLSGVSGTSKEITFTDESGFEVKNGITYVWGDIDEDNSASLGVLSGSDKYRIVVWLDGNDREANIDLLDGKFTAIFKIAPKD